ncbi:MAG: YihY/virulence factor BrkB family protein [Anaerolineales bacterium]|nr:YihY/virulence factor BrkB family protein [Anaerolineales bacterium]
MNVAKSIFKLIRDAGMKWSEDKASIFAAALAYYTMFSLAPLLVLVVAFASRILRNANVQEVLLNFVQLNLGGDVASIVADILQSSALQSASSLLASLVSTVILIWGATGVFNHLKRALNTIWGVEPAESSGLHSILYFIQTRLLALLLVLGLGGLLIATVLFNTILSVVNGLIADYFPKFTAVSEGQQAGLVLAFLLPAVAFAVIFKALPDAEVAWRDVWLGAVVTAVLFALGNYLISIYLRYSSVASAYGAAGSLIVMLLWVYYSAQIFFFGAEFTQVYANQHGSKVMPAEHAVAVRRQRLDELLEPPAAPPPAYPLAAYQPPPGDSPLRQRSKQLGFGLLGLAAGLMVGFIANLRQDG